MCGILGYVNKDKIITPDFKINFENSLDLIGHRGPDDRGTFYENGVMLGHTRLSIIDLSDAGHQPLVSNDTGNLIVYNGEVYNFVDLKINFSLSGFSSSSDTEVVLKLYDILGVDSFRELNGMFSFSIYDKKSQKLWLVRDRLGIKPLYYRLDQNNFFFASEVKALSSLGNYTSQCDLSLIHEWLYYGNTLGDKTLYEGINKLLPGHYLELDLVTWDVKIECYWSPTQYAGCDKYTDSIDERILQTRNLLEQAVKRQLVSDVPVGVFLSGGIDSSAITAFASRHYEGRLATYSVGFDFDKGVNELPRARKIAQFFGTDHHELHIAGFEIADIVEKMVAHHDMPFSDAANIPLYLLSSKVNDSIKVVLQGDGGDELFGGYSRYMTLSFYRIARFLAKIGGFANQFTPRNAKHYRRQRYIHALTSDDLAGVMASLLTEEDNCSDLTVLFTPEFRKAIVESDPFSRYQECQQYFISEDVVNQMLYVDSMIILPDIFLEKVDRSTMAASVETRVPFLDNDLVDFCMRLSGSQKVRFGQKKWLLKKALEGIVPNYVLYGKKTGFGVPYGYWLRGALKPLFFDHLETFRSQNPSVLNYLVIQEMFNDHISRRKDHSFMLWKILIFLIWVNRQGVKLTC